MDRRPLAVRKEKPVNSFLERAFGRPAAEWSRLLRWIVRLGVGAAGFAAVFALHVLTLILVGGYRAPGFGGVWFCGFLFAAVLVFLADRRLKS